ncbi:MAG: hypothetical protein ACJ0HK_06975 [Akkermansiaceae bacterium]|nr:hypothetical protein [bacterium]
MKLLLFPSLVICALALSSCGLLRSATQMPIRTLQGVGRAVGVGLEQSEVLGKEKSATPTKWKALRGD